MAGGASDLWTYSDTAADQPSNAFGELRQQSTTVDGTVVADIVYDAPDTSTTDRRDALGRIRFKKETFRAATHPHDMVTNTWEYRYDERGQLQTALLNNDVAYAASYDSAGNRTTYQIGSTVHHPVFDAQDRLVSGIGTLTWTYYDNGETKTRSDAASVTSTLHYDAMGRLRFVMRPNKPRIEYVLDGEGRRIAKKEGLFPKRRWLYGRVLSPIAEVDDTGTVSQYIYGSNSHVPDLVIRGGNTYRLITDHLGSPVYAVNVNNKDDVPYQVTWGPFGEPIVGGGLPVSTLGWIPFGFAGGLYDPDTGYTHFGAREYDSVTGRWLSKDPIRFGGRQANLYTYVGNDPINRLDPTGLYSLCDGLASAEGWAACEVVCSFATKSPLACGLACSLAGSVAQDAMCGDPPKPPAPCPPGTMPNPEPGWASFSCVPLPDDCVGSSCACGGGAGPEGEPNETPWY
jgi:RHS repeat-associated protein